MSGEFGARGQDGGVEVDDEKLCEHDDVDQGESQPCPQKHRPSSQLVPVYLHASLA